MACTRRPGGSSIRRRRIRATPGCSASAAARARGHARADAGHVPHDLRTAGVLRLHRPAVGRGVLVCQRRRDRSARARHGCTPPTWKDRLRTLFADDAGPAVEIIDATGEELAAYPIFDMPAVPRWHAGPMVITGDAAHATSPSAGQGASMAMEDAVVLAQCLRDAGDVGRGVCRVRAAPAPAGRARRALLGAGRPDEIARADRPLVPRPVHAGRAQDLRQSRVARVALPLRLLRGRGRTTSLSAAFS